MDEDGLFYDTNDLVYDDRYCIKLPFKPSKEDFLKTFVNLKSFYNSSLECLQRINHSSYKVDKDDILSYEKLSELIQDVNHLYNLWPSLFAITSNFMNDDEDPLYTGSFLLTIYEKSTIGLYDGNISKAKLKFNINEFSTYKEFSDKIDLMCDNWNTFRKPSEDEKLDLFLKISTQG